MNLTFVSSSSKQSYFVFEIKIIDVILKLKQLATCTITDLANVTEDIFISLLENTSKKFLKQLFILSLHFLMCTSLENVRTFRNYCSPDQIRGGGVMPYMCHTETCCRSGYTFWPSNPRQGVFFEPDSKTGCQICTIIPSQGAYPQYCLAPSRWF